MKNRKFFTLPVPVCSASQEVTGLQKSPNCTVVHFTLIWLILQTFLSIFWGDLWVNQDYFEPLFDCFRTFCLLFLTFLNLFVHFYSFLIFFKTLIWLFRDFCLLFWTFSGLFKLFCKYFVNFWTLDYFFQFFRPFS